MTLVHAIKHHRDTDALQEANLRKSAWQKIVAAVGISYAKASFKTFNCDQPEQRDVVSRLTNFRHSNLILYGPPGTGKDHLMLATARNLVYAGIIRSPEWTTGALFFQALRDGMTAGCQQANVMKPYMNSDALLLSDPVPPGEITAYQSQALYLLLDHRSRNGLVTYATVNVDGGTDLREQLGPASCDRLKDNATIVKCYWKSYRQPKKE